MGKLVVYVRWVESERGWGVRPDGCSLHMNIGDFETFEKRYWESMPDNVPDEYSIPAGSPTMVLASKEIYNEIRGSKGGVRLSYNVEMNTIRRGKLRFVR